MKAIQMTEQGAPDVLRLAELPYPVPGPGQVLVRVEAAAVNFSDVKGKRVAAVTAQLLSGRAAAVS